MSEQSIPGWADVPAPEDPCITDVLAASLATLGDLPGANETMRQELGLETGARQLLMILVDGLGSHPLVDHFGYAPTLRSFREQMRSIHTIAPSTTAAAITSFGTGERPGATRMVGYSIVYGHGVMNLLAFEGGPVPEQWQECPTHFERLASVSVSSAVISPPAFADSGLTRAALRGARHVGAVSLEDRCDAALRELRAGTPIVYLYWSDIDHAGHIHGLSSWEWASALEEFDRGLGRLLSRLPSDVRTVLTADHGMVDIDHSQLLDLADQTRLAEGVRIIAGETRAVHVHAEPGCAEEVVERWSNELADRAWVCRPRDAAAVMGQGPGLEAIGDAVVFMKGRFGVVDSRVQSAKMIALPGVHGSLTSEEMRIPVIALS